jgi:hypothetical protein
MPLYRVTIELDLPAETDDEIAIAVDGFRDDIVEKYSAELGDMPSPHVAVKCEKVAE